MLKIVASLLLCVALSSANPRLDALLGANNATMFVSLIQRAGLSNVLTDTTVPHTLIVPTDAAFNKLTQTEIETIANDDYMLTNIMEYHIVKGEVFSFDLTSGIKMQSRNGHVLRVYASSSGQVCFIKTTIHHVHQHARVIVTDLQASNGVVYLVDTVLEVPEGTLTDVLSTPSYNATMFERLTEAAGLLPFSTVAEVTSPRFTVFAPTDAAMRSMDQAFLARISATQYYARMLVEYHIVRGTAHVDSLKAQTNLQTLLPGHYITVTPVTNTTNPIRLNRVASLILTDIEAEDGVMHTISHVLIPSNLAGIQIG
ncbi:hypothetical protein ScPMuIL_009963 [Solemya velum]